jgi:hypothetical protein
MCYAKASQLLNRRRRMRLYAGIDLHANSHYLGVIDEQSKLLFKHKMVNNLKILPFSPVDNKTIEGGVENDGNRLKRILLKSGDFDSEEVHDRKLVS